MKTFTKSILAAASAVFLALSAQAITLTTAVGFGERYVGSITDGINASSENETLWLNALRQLSPGGTGESTGTPAGQGPEALARSLNTFTGLPVATFVIKDEDSNLTLGSLTGISYLIGKYGNNNDAGQVSLVWYVGGLTGTGHTIGNTAGLSHVSYFTSTTFPPVTPPGVPDGGSTVALLGLAVAALAFAKRKF